MCGRYALFTEEENQEVREIINELNERYKEEAAKIKTGEIFPTNFAPVITANDNSRKIINMFKWGFPNFRQPSGVIINARSETIGEKPTFKKLLFTGRCLIPASGFYEWKAAESGASNIKKDKFIIRIPEDGLMYMAGLYNRFIDKNGLPYTGYVIITADANEQMSLIHNRMPVILNESESRHWISTSEIDVNDAIKLLKPYGGKLRIEKAG